MSNTDTEILAGLEKAVEAGEMFKWTFPRRCLMDGHKRVCQILSYDGNGFFTILRGNDKVFVRRSRLTFIPDPKEN